MRGPAGSITGGAAGMDEPADTVRRGGGRRQRSKQASRRAAIHRQMTRIINEHNAQQQQQQHARLSIRGKHNHILELTKGGTQALSMLGGSEEAKEWMTRRLAATCPDQPAPHIASMMDTWVLPLRDMDPAMLKKEEHSLATTLRRWYVPRYGNMEETREDGVFRIMGGQLNSISGPTVRVQKLQDIKRIIQTWDVQGGCLSEVGINWARQRRSERLQEWLRPDFEDIRVITANNTTENISVSQVGGVAQFVLGELAQYARSFSEDFRGLGRWSSWCIYADSSHVTRIVSAYNLAHHQSTEFGSAFQQYTRYIQISGISNHTPRSLFHADFTGVLRRWIQDGERLLIFIDLNEHILDSRLARDLMELGLKEATHPHWPEGVEPRTYIRGRGPIDAVYFTPDLEIVATLQLSFHEGVGDHRTVLVDVSSRSMIGKDSFKIVRPTARRLTLANKKYVEKYIKVLERKIIEHKLCQRLNECARILADDPTNNDAREHLEIIDNEVTEYQRFAEKKCRKIYVQPLAFSLPVQYWVRRRWAYHGLLRLAQHRCSNPANIRRAARRAGIEGYKHLTVSQIKTGLAFCTAELRKMRGTDIHLRQQHLENMASVADESKDKGREKAVRRVMSAESQKQIWKRINRATNPPRGGAIQRVQKEQGEELVELVTLEDMSREIQSVTEKRFSLAESAPAFTSSLRHSAGFTADTQFALDLISGKEEIPTDVDATTFMLLTEMRRLWSSTDAFRRTTFEILPGHYDFYWRRAKERTSSSFANIHFGHWKAAVFSETLKSFFAAKLTVIGTYGIPPSRWSSGLQVMLEKVAGVALVNKLRAILLMEGDFNFFNKWTFGHMAMNELYRIDFIPQDQYSQRGFTAEDARMDSRLTTDLSRQLRHPMAIAAVDADQCYDRINHIIMSLVLLAVVGSAGLVAALLRPIQTMKFFQRTAWGDSSSYMGGRSNTRPLHGLCQGNGAAPACWLMLSSLLMHCYQRQGFGSKILSPISGILIEFMGEMFVDDTDLIVIRPDLCTGREVFDEMQSAVWNWGMNLNSTGGGLKGPKCYWWLIDYEYTNGSWNYKAKVDWELMIPLPDGTSCIVDQASCDTSMKMLGVWSCPSGIDNTHLKENVVGKMETWIIRTRNGRLPSSLAWRSYQWKLWPGLRYGLATLGNPIDTLDTILGRQQYEVLPFLGVNRNIRRQWRTIPQTFGGVGLFNISIEQTIGWINMFLQHYGMDSTLGGKFRASMEALQLEIGCLGCPLESNYDRYGLLATPCWMKSFWERLSHYDFKLHVRYPALVLPREGDAPIMQFLFHAGFSGKRLVQLNRCRIALRSMFVSDLTSADGRCFLAADPDRYGASGLRSTPYQFPREEPSVADWTVWYGAWRSLTTTGWILPRPLGRWLCRPTTTWNWMYDEANKRIQNLRDGQWYEPITAQTNTRSNKLFMETEQEVPPTMPPLWKSATVATLDGNALLLLDVGPPVPLMEEAPPLDFWTHLAAQGGEWMWDHVVGNKSMEWFRDALTNGTAMMVADGSYSRELDPHLSGTGWVIACTRSQHVVKGSFFERSSTASSYRGELLGMVAIHALVATAAAVYDLPAHQGSIHCDNLGALGKARAHGRRVKSSLKQGDLVRAIRAMKQGLFLQLRYQYVKSHQDDVIGWNDLPLDQRMNVMCDTLAKQAVGRGLSFEAVTRVMKPLSLPFEQASIIVGGNKLTSDVSDPVRFILGQIEAKRFYTRAVDIQENGVNRGGLGWTSEQFESVDWDSLHQALQRRPVMFRIWLSKQSMGANATRRNMARIENHDDDICPNCKLVRERSSHLNQCTDVGRTALFDKSVDKLQEWMERGNRTEPELTYWLIRILRLRGSMQGIRLDQMSPEVEAVVRDIFRIGWVELLHGKIPRSLTSLQGNYCVSYRTHQGMTGQSWARAFIYQLLQISHAQWLYRNFTLHHSTRGYLATKARLEILHKISDLASVQASDIPESSQFLLEIDFKGLILSRLDRQSYWVAAMQAAIKAGRRMSTGTWKRTGRTQGTEATRGTRGTELSVFRHTRIIESMVLGNGVRKRSAEGTHQDTDRHTGLKRRRTADQEREFIPAHSR